MKPTKSGEAVDMVVIHFCTDSTDKILPLRMTKPIHLILSLILLLLYSISSYAQLKVVLAHEAYTIPKFSDGNVIPYINSSVKQGVIYPINESKYDLEIRYYYYYWFKPNGMQDILVIKGNKDSLFVEDYCVDTELASTIKKVNSSKPIQQLLKALIANKIAELPDQALILEEIKKKHVKLNEPPPVSDCCTNVPIEVKIQGHYRNFSYNPLPIMGNQQILSFKYESAIATLFDELWHDAKRHD